MDIKVIKISFILLSLIVLSCIDKQQKKTQQNTGVNCLDEIPFKHIKNIYFLKNKDNDSISFDLSYELDSCYIAKGIVLYKTRIKFRDIKSNFFLGIKNDTLFSGILVGDNESTIWDIQPFIDFNDDTKPKQLPNNLLGIRRLTLDSIYNLADERVYRISIFNELPFESSEDISFHKFYVSKESGIKFVEMIENKTGIVYSNNWR